MPKDYVSISLPKNFVEKIDEIIKDKKKGYVSRAEFLREAVRQKLREFGVII